MLSFWYWRTANRYLTVATSTIIIATRPGGELDLILVVSEVVFQGSSYKKVFWKYAANLQENENVKLNSNFIEISLQHGCSINLMHIIRAVFYKNTSGWLLPKIFFLYFYLTVFKRNKWYLQLSNFFGGFWLIFLATFFIEGKSMFFPVLGFSLCWILKFQK